MVNRIIIIVCSVLVLLLTGCKSEGETPVVEDYIPSSQEIFEYYDLDNHLGDPEYLFSSYDISSEISYRLAHLPTSYAHTSVETYENEINVIIEIELNNGYHASSDVLNMIVDELQLILNNSDYKFLNYDVEVDFLDGNEYYTVHDGFKMIDSGFGGHSYLRKE